MTQALNLRRRTVFIGRGPRPRNPFAVAARMRQGGPLRDRRQRRGGSRNLHQEWLFEWSQEAIAVAKTADDEDD